MSDRLCSQRCGRNRDAERSRGGAFRQHVPEPDEDCPVIGPHIDDAQRNRNAASRWSSAAHASANSSDAPDIRTATESSVCNPTRSRPVSPARNAKRAKSSKRRSRRGKIFFGCGRYPKCKFAAWNKSRPAAVPVVRRELHGRERFEAHRYHLAMRQQGMRLQSTRPGHRTARARPGLDPARVSASPHA